MRIDIIILIIIILLISYLIAIYNKFAKLRATIDSAWADIDVQLKKRYNLIPNLVEIVKAYAKYEKDTLNRVIEARNKAINASSIEDKALANSNLSNALGTIFALAESYPNLKANENFKELQMQLNQIEEDIANARRYYNAVVRDYNAMLESFPDQLIAKKFNYKKRDYFELNENEKEEIIKNPSIKF